MSVGPFMVPEALLTVEQVFNLVSAGTGIPRRLLRGETVITATLLPSVQKVLEERLSRQIQFVSPTVTIDGLLVFLLPVMSKEKGQGKNGRK